MQGKPDPFASDPWLSEKPRSAAKAPRWLVIGLIGCGSLIVLVFLGFIAVGAGVTMGYLPDTKALPEKDIPKATLEWLRDRGLVEAEERVRYFYAGGMFQLDEGGCFFTDRRVVNFWSDDAEGVESFAAPLSDVMSIEATWGVGWMEDTQLWLETADLGETVLDVSNEEAGDRAFERELREACRTARSLAIPGLSADGNMKLEAQVETLARFGVALPDGFSIDDLCTAQPREDYEELPFELLFAFFSDVEREWTPGREDPGDVLVLDAEALADGEECAVLAQRVCDLTDGALPIASVSHEIDSELGMGVLHFEIDGRNEAWPIDDEEDSSSDSILSRFVALLAERDSHRRFAVWTREEGGLVLPTERHEWVLVCIREEELVELRRQTGLAFDWLE